MEEVDEWDQFYTWIVSRRVHEQILIKTKTISKERVLIMIFFMIYFIYFE